LLHLIEIVLIAREDDQEGADDIDECHYAAWEQVSVLLSHHQEGRALDLREQAVLREVPTAWICPITRRLLATAPGGVTPYVTEGLEEHQALCRRVEMPMVPDPCWWRNGGSEYERPESVAWIESQETIRELTRLGVWSSLSTRIISFSPYFQTAEHSAQIDAIRLRELEDRFRDGKVNVLSCS